MLKELIRALYEIRNAIKGEGNNNNDDKDNNISFTDLYGIKAIRISEGEIPSNSYKEYAIPLKLYAKDPSDIPDFENKFANETLLVTDLFDGNVTELVKLIEDIIKNEPDVDYHLILNSDYEKFSESHEYYSVESGYTLREFGTQLGIKGIEAVNIAVAYTSIMIHIKYQQWECCGWYYNAADVDNLLTTPVQGTTTD